MIRSTRRRPPSFAAARKTVIQAALVLGATAFAACTGRSGDDEPPAPPAPLDLRGTRVMLLPVPAPAPAQIDRELQFWLTDRAPQAEWLLPAELQEVVDRSPGWRIRLDALPPGVVDTGGGDLRVRDPLFGDLRRLAAVTDAGYAVLPLRIRAVADTAIDPEGPTTSALELTAALAEVRSGRVIWFGAVRGEAAPEGDARRAASVAESLARALLH